MVNNPCYLPCRTKELRIMSAPMTRVSSLELQNLSLQIDSAPILTSISTSFAKTDYISNRFEKHAILPLVKQKIFLCFQSGQGLFQTIFSSCFSGPICREPVLMLGLSALFLSRHSAAHDQLVLILASSPQAPSWAWVLQCLLLVCPQILLLQTTESPSYWKELEKAKKHCLANLNLETYGVVGWATTRHPTCTISSQLHLVHSLERLLCCKISWTGQYYIGV